MSAVAPELLRDSAPSPETTRVCRTCRRERKLHHFHRVGRGSSKRRNQCRSCASAESQERQLRKRERFLSQTSSKIIAAGERGNYHALNLVAAELLQRFGGHRRLSAAFKAAADRAEEAGRHATAGRMLTAVVHLVVAAERRPPTDERKYMSDEALRRRICESVIDLVEQDPHIAIAALRDRGYRVEPPEDIGARGA